MPVLHSVSDIRGDLGNVDEILDMRDSAVNQLYKSIFKLDADTDSIDAKILSRVTRP